MEKVWQLQEAKSRFSEVVDRALREGPQEVSRHGKRAVVVIAHDELDRILRGPESLVDFLRNSPMQGLDIERPRDLPRDISL